MKILVVSLIVVIASFLFYSNAQAKAGAKKAYALYKEHKALVLDVRTTGEVKSHAVPEAKNIPINELSSKISDLKKSYKSDHPIVLFCESGYRSARAAKALRQAGFTNIVDIKSWRNWPTCVAGQCN